jgi:hypothetical protein
MYISYIHTQKIYIFIYISIFIHIYAWLCISDKSDSNVTGVGGELYNFAFLRHSHNLWSNIMLFESRFGLVKMHISNARTAAKNIFKSIVHLLRSKEK